MQITEEGLGVILIHAISMENRMKLTSVSLLTWALNEEENIDTFFTNAIDLLKSISDDFEIIFINDGSTDETKSKATKWSNEHNNIKIFDNNVNRGVGFSMKKAIKMSSKNHLFWQTLDWSYDLEIFRKIDIQMDMESVLHCTRVKPGQRIYQSVFNRSDSVYKGIVSILNFFVVKKIFKLPFSDVQNVTVYPGPLVRKIELSCNSSFASPELLIKTLDSGINFFEISIPFLRRKTGQAKGTKLSSVWASIIEIFRFKMSYKIPASRSKSKLIKLDH